MPNKWGLRIGGRRIVEHIIDRTKLVKNADQIVLCTSDNPNDDILEVIAKENNIKCFRGSETDKLVRWRDAARKFGADYIVEVDGDDPMCDPELMELSIEQMEEKPCDMLTLPKDIVCGGVNYCFSHSALEKVCEIKGTDETEMMWTYFKDTGLFDLRELKVEEEIFHNDKVRMTLDYPEDLRFFERIFSEFNTCENNIPLRKILNLIAAKPEIAEINFFRQNEFLQNQQNKTKLVLKDGLDLESLKKNEAVKKENELSFRQWRYTGNEMQYVAEVLGSGFASATCGNMNQRLEQLFAEKVGAKYAITVNSGTTTLHAALASFGVGEGDEVLIPALTVIMCAYAVMYCNARPVFVDVDPDTFLMDPIDLERKITSKTKAIMPVHLYGQVCDMERIMDIARRYDLRVIEDCAQCFLGKDNKGRIGGVIGDVGSFSFENSKHLSTGDGGILTTNDETLAERMRKFAGMGFKNIKAANGQVRKNKDAFQHPDYLRHDVFGWNYRMSEVTAAVGLAQTERMEELVGKRTMFGNRMKKVVENSACDWLSPQHTPDGYVNTYWTFALRYDGQEKINVSWFDFRKKFMEYGGEGIYSAWALLYNEPIMKTVSEQGTFFRDFAHQGEAFKGICDNVHCPNAERLQPKMMHFPANFASEKEMQKQEEALKKAIDFFNK